VGKTVGEPSPVFTALLDNVASRAGHVKVRIGGNSQENSELVATLPDGVILQKADSAVSINNATNPSS
jgi:hypothetical protein